MKQRQHTWALCVTIVAAFSLAGSISAQAAIVGVSFATTASPSQPDYAEGSGSGGAVSGWVDIMNTAGATATVGPIEALFVDEDPIFDDVLAAWIGDAILGVPAGAIVRYNLLPVSLSGSALQREAWSFEEVLLDGAGVLEFAMRVIVTEDPVYPVAFLTDTEFQMFVGNFLPEGVGSDGYFFVRNVTGKAISEPSVVSVLLLGLLTMACLPRMSNSTRA